MWGSPSVLRCPATLKPLIIITSLCYMKYCIKFLHFSFNMKCIHMYYSSTCNSRHCHTYTKVGIFWQTADTMYWHAKNLHYALKRETNFEPPHGKTNNVVVRPAKTRISLGIRPVWSSLRCPHEEGLGPQLPIECTAKTDQTGRMPRLIWVFTGRTGHFVGFVVQRLIYVIQWDTGMFSEMWPLYEQEQSLP